MLMPDWLPAQVPLVLLDMLRRVRHKSLEKVSLRKVSLKKVSLRKVSLKKYPEREMLFQSSATAEGSTDETSITALISALSHTLFSLGPLSYKTAEQNTNRYYFPWKQKSVRNVHNNRTIWCIVLFKTITRVRVYRLGERMKLHAIITQLWAASQKTILL